MVQYNVPPTPPCAMPFHGDTDGRQTFCGGIDRRQIMSVTTALEQSLSHLEDAVKKVEWASAQESQYHAAARSLASGGSGSALHASGSAIHELSHLNKLADGINTELHKLCLHQHSVAPATRGGAPPPAAVPTTRLMLPRGGGARGPKYNKGTPATRTHHQAPSHNADTLVDAKAEAGMFTLSASLNLLSKSNPECCFVVHHINKLGHKAHQRLQSHFSQFGTVVRVLVTYSLSRESYRPNSVGFIQMASTEVVRKILRCGETEVAGVMVSMQPFVHKEKGGAGLQSQFRAQGGMPNHRTVELF